jgi:two-component system, NarL family, sensor histidine kinase UhpB
VALDELGLRSAIEYGIEQWQRRHPAVRCTFEARGDLDNLGEQVNITLYRLVQECLTNVVKHADAGKVSIALCRDSNPAGGGDALRLHFEDDGRGFDTTVRQQGLGLAGLRERVEALAGHFELESAPGHGVRIEAIIPAKGAR